MAKIETFENCTVELLTDEKTGELISIGWHRENERPMKIVFNDETELTKGE